MRKIPIWKTGLRKWVCNTNTKREKNTTDQQQIRQIQTPGILEDREFHKCAEGAKNPDAATIHMLTNDPSANIQRKPK